MTREAEIRDYLACHLDHIAPGLELVQTEYRLPIGRVDILAETDDAYYLIEIKARKAVAHKGVPQLLLYREAFRPATDKVVIGVFITPTENGLLRRLCAKHGIRFLTLEALELDQRSPPPEPPTFPTPEPPTRAPRAHFREDEAIERFLREHPEPIWHELAAKADPLDALIWHLLCERDVVTARTVQERIGTVSRRTVERRLQRAVDHGIAVETGQRPKLLRQNERVPDLPAFCRLLLRREGLTEDGLEPRP